MPKTSQLNFNIPPLLKSQLTEYCKVHRLTATELICSLLDSAINGKPIELPNPPTYFRDKSEYEKLREDLINELDKKLDQKIETRFNSLLSSLKNQPKPEPKPEPKPPYQGTIKLGEYGIDNKELLSIINSIPKGEKLSNKKLVEFFKKHGIIDPSYPSKFRNYRNGETDSNKARKPPIWLFQVFDYESQKLGSQTGNWVKII